MGDYMSGYREKVTDEQLISLIDIGVSNSAGDYSLLTNMQDYLKVI
jgi:hypothetical protein